MTDKSLKDLIARLRKFIKPYIKSFIVFLLVFSTIVAAWIMFLKYLDKKYLVATPLLIMIWASVIILLLGMFPKILGNIKRVKFLDVEIDLKDLIAKPNVEGYISLYDSDESAFTNKEVFSNLESILAQSCRQPSKPIYWS